MRAASRGRKFPLRKVDAHTHTHTQTYTRAARHTHTMNAQRHCIHSETPILNGTERHRDREAERQNDNRLT